MNDDHNGENTMSSDRSISRRRMLQVLGAVPVAAALGPTTALEQATSQAVAQPVQTAPRFFTPHEWRTVRLLVDYIIPRDDVSGSATDAKVPEYIDYLLAEKDASPTTQVAMRGGLAWIDTESLKRFDKRFADAGDGQRRRILDDIAYPDKAPPGMSYGVAFFTRLRDMTASGFFSSATGWKDLQYIGNVFNPGYDGCPPAALEKLGVTYDVMTSRVSPQER
jgi:gluconate 2-dehydrogenase gamma chain